MDRRLEDANNHNNQPASNLKPGIVIILNHSVRPCLGGHRGAVQRGARGRGRGGGGGSAINITYLLIFIYYHSVVPVRVEVSG